MVGEFFIRYDNMEFDDHTEHNDTSTRVLSLVLFLSGIVIQICIISYYTLYLCCNKSSDDDGGGGDGVDVELVGVGGGSGGGIVHMKMRRRR